MAAAQQYGVSGYPGATDSIQGADTNAQLTTGQYMPPSYPPPPPAYDPNADD